MTPCPAFHLQKLPYYSVSRELCVQHKIIEKEQRRVPNLGIVSKMKPALLFLTGQRKIRTGVKGFTYSYLAI